jgi:hypothetical protein
MKRIPPFVYLVALLISLVLAYFTWTQGPKKPEGGVTLLECGKGSLEKVTLREKERKVVFDRRQNAWSGEKGWWVEASRLPFQPASKPDAAQSEDLNVDTASLGPDEDAPAGGTAAGTVAGGRAAAPGPQDWTVSESFPGNDTLQEALDEFCPWNGLRSLGKPGEAKRGEFGLAGTEDSLVLTIRGKPREFLVGKTSFGPGDRYVEDKNTGEIFLVSGQSIKNLLYPKSRYMDRSLHVFEEKDAARMHVSEGSREMELVHRFSAEGADEGWAVNGSEEGPKELYKNWVGKVFTLRPMDYPVPEQGKTEAGPNGCAVPAGVETVVSITFFSDKKEIGFLTVYKKTGEPEKAEFLACTEHTGAVVLVSKIQAENLLKDLADLLPES